jgi:hypothetical protein
MTPRRVLFCADGAVSQGNIRSQQKRTKETKVDKGSNRYGRVSFGYILKLFLKHKGRR